MFWPGAHLYERPARASTPSLHSYRRDYPYDVRGAGECAQPDAYWADTMLHEFDTLPGDKHINPSLPYPIARRPHQHHRGDSAMIPWRATRPGSPPSPASRRTSSKPTAKVFPSGATADKSSLTRWALVMQLLSRPPSTRTPDREERQVEPSRICEVKRARTAATSPIGQPASTSPSPPIYYHNYVLGHHCRPTQAIALESDSLGAVLPERDCGRYLQEAIFGPGARTDWRRLSQWARKLDPGYFRRPCVRARQDHPAVAPDPEPRWRSGLASGFPPGTGLYLPGSRVRKTPVQSSRV